MMSKIKYNTFIQKHDNEFFKVYFYAEQNNKRIYENSLVCPHWHLTANLEKSMIERMKKILKDN